MYKKFSLEQLTKINAPFFNNLKKLYGAGRYPTLKDFLKDTFKYGNIVYFYESSAPIFKVCKEGNCFKLTDEVDKLELYVDEKEVNDLNRLLRDDKKVKIIKKDNKTILEELFDEFYEGGFSHINEIPYLVYDIETIGDMNNLKNMKFMLGYSVISNEDHSQNIKYKSVSIENLKKFVDFMLNFDGFVIGYNNIYFDNVVSAYNVGYSADEIKKLNDKSLDIFLFIRNLTGRRIGLDKVAKALIGVGKTLSSGMEGTQLLIKYNQTGDKALLSKVQSYCKNDVKMTLGVLLYLIKYKKLYLDNEEVEFDIHQMITLGKHSDEKQKKEVITDQGFFGF